MSKKTDIDRAYMRRALMLAQKARGYTNPNPMVGAVIVKNGRVISAGYHRRAGGPHAEIEALRGAKEPVTGATLYVSLEPCRHFGRTPPCTDAIKASGIARVVFASTDPNPKVRGKGATILRRADISVTAGVLKKEAGELNETYMAFHKKRRPFIAVKFAASLDGKIATRTGDSKWISSGEARRFTRMLRGSYQAILVGVETVRADDPHLGAPAFAKVSAGKRDPLRIILDSRLRIPLQSRVLRDSNVLVVTTKRAARSSRRAFEKKGISLLMMRSAKIDLPALMRELYKREVVSVLVEGGGSVLGSFLDAKLIDKVYAVHAPVLIGGKNAVGAFKGTGAATVAEALHLKKVSFRQFGDTMATIGYA